jgi:hypothetical protein
MCNMSLQTSQKNMCLCDITECPFKCVDVFRKIVNESPIGTPSDFIRMRFHYFVVSRLKELIDDVINESHISLTQIRIDYICDQHVGFI